MAKTQRQKNIERKAANADCKPYLYILKDWGFKSDFAKKIGVTMSALSMHLQTGTSLGAPNLKKLAALLKKEHERREAEKADTQTVVCDELVECAEV